MACILCAVKFIAGTKICFIIMVLLAKTPEVTLSLILPQIYGQTVTTFVSMANRIS